MNRNIFEVGPKGDILPPSEPGEPGKIISKFARPEAPASANPPENQQPVEKVSPKSFAELDRLPIQGEAVQVLELQEAKPTAEVVVGETR